MTRTVSADTFSQPTVRTVCMYFIGRYLRRQQFFSIKLLAYIHMYLYVILHFNINAKHVLYMYKYTLSAQFVRGYAAYRQFKI